MAKVSASETIEDLELKSLQLDVLQLQRKREKNTKEFLEFTKTMAANFETMQDNFTTIQANFSKFFSSQDEVKRTRCRQDKGE
jgi:hypothetical protein